MATMADKIHDVDVRLSSVETRLTEHDKADQARHQESIESISKLENLLEKQFKNLWLLVKILLTIATTAGLGTGVGEVVARLAGAK